MSSSATELRRELERALAEGTGRARHISRFETRPCPYRTSFALQELDISLDDGTTLRVMLKDLSRESLAEEALRAKPDFMHDPMREIETYRRILAGAGLGTPELYGTAVDAGRGRYWLFIENVEGDVLWQVGDLETWKAAAQWLARMHEMFLGRIDRAWDQLLRYDAAFHRLWMERALAFARDPGTAWEPEARERVEWLAARWEPVAERLAALPDTFIHGEFYPSNILVGRTGSQPRICPIDWEMAAAGPGLVDLAALTGGWPKTDRAALAAAYREACDRGAEQPGGFDEALEACRLHLAVRWLGWEPTWSPPPEHRQDWLAEAVRAARALGLD